MRARARRKDRLPMDDFPRCASCGIRRYNVLTEVRVYGDELLCDMCVRESMRGAVMVEDPEYLRPPGAERGTLVGR